ncbi:MAG TPA: lipocalin family protein [Ignavibacteriaceae bacterium]|nr:lipocalin family protein [Ignavibacteriaceae bacterium]
MKNRFDTFILVILALIAVSLTKAQNLGETKEVKTVSNVELNKYVGKWYEIARIPNSFQKNCESNVTANYTLRDDGKINVLNKCVEDDGSVNEAEGLAQVVDKKTNSKLEVSFVSIFGIHLFWGDYWIIGLDENYEYAVIGHPDRKYGWILSRTSKLSKDKLDEAFEILERNGYNPKDFVMTVQ